MQPIEWPPAYTEAELDALEERSREQLYLAKKTRFKYRRELQLALRDRPIVERKLVAQAPLQPQLPPAQARACVVAGIAFSALALGVFFFLLWVITGGPFR